MDFRDDTNTDTPKTIFRVGPGCKNATDTFSLHNQYDDKNTKSMIAFKRGWCGIYMYMNITTEIIWSVYFSLRKSTIKLIEDQVLEYTILLIDT